MVLGNAQMSSCETSWVAELVPWLPFPPGSGGTRDEVNPCGGAGGWGGGHMEDHRTHRLGTGKSNGGEMRSWWVLRVLPGDRSLPPRTISQHPYP